MRSEGVLWSLFVAAIPVISFVCVVSAAFEILHSIDLVLPNLDLSVPYHYDPRYAKRRAKLLQRPPYTLLFTGDSRVNNGIDPSLIDSVDSFTMGTGGQTIPLTRAIVLDTLVEIDRRPRYLAIGITPDYLIEDAMQRDPRTAQLLEQYERAKVWQREASRVDRFVAAYLPAFFYRENVLRDLARLLLLSASGVRPPERVFDIPLLRPVTWSQYVSFHVEPQSELGWERQSLSGFVEGGYPFAEPRPLLQDSYRADDAALTDLVRSLRAVRIEPLFLIMPLHDTFYDIHGQALREEVLRCVRTVAAREAVTVIDLPFDTSQADLYVDGHHLSARGAEVFSRRLSGRLGEIPGAEGSP